jgi:hypothetical protein
MGPELYVLLFLSASSTDVEEQVVVYPMWESRQSLREIGGHIVRDVFGGGKGVKKEVVQA